jgi:putative DNA primase/helicase
VCGYVLTGSTREQVFFFLYGTGANGKSLVLNLLRWLLGDYASQTQPEALMAQRDVNPGGVSPHIARLAGVRLVCANETGEGQRLDEPTIKQITGGDALVARMPYGLPFEFTPVFKLVMAGNYRPVIRGDDHGIWRRIILIPFSRRFTPEEQDHTLPDTLQDEGAGILNWMLSGTRQWLRDGLCPPASVMREVASYRTEMDTLQQWVDDTCTVDTAATYQVGAAYSEFARYVIGSGGAAPNKARFSERMKARGFVTARGAKGVRHFVGIGRRAGGAAGH